MKTYSNCSLTAASAFAVACLWLAPTPATQAHDNLPGKAPTGPVVISGATIHTVSGMDISNGRLRFENGRIVAVGGIEVSIAGATVIDAGGQQLYPGFIAAEGTLGLAEVAAVRATVDVSEVGANNADIRAEVAVNPDSEIIPVTRANGVLLALSEPGSSSGNVIAGRSALLRLDGWSSEDMVVKAPVALHVSWPGGEIPSWLPAPAQDAARAAQKSSRDALQKAFEDARRYSAARQSNAVLAADRRLEAMQAAVTAQQPVFFHADDAQSIQESLDFAREFALKAVIVGGADAWQLTDVLKADDVPVILSGLLRLPQQRGDSVDSIFSGPARLSEAGVRFAISNGGGAFDTSNLRNLPYHAASAVGFGLPHQEALRSITLYPAQILGVADRYGSLAEGRSATLFLSDGDALEPASNVLRAWIDGREIDLSSRQTRLYDKYRQKYPETRDDS